MRVQRSPFVTVFRCILNCHTPKRTHAYKNRRRPDLIIDLLFLLCHNATADQAVYAGEGYVGIGFSDSGSMSGSDAVVGLPDAGTALEYDMPNKNTPTVQDVQARF